MVEGYADRYGLDIPRGQLRPKPTNGRSPAARAPAEWRGNSSKTSPAGWEKASIRAGGPHRSRRREDAALRMRTFIL